MARIFRVAKSLDPGYTTVQGSTNRRAHRAHGHTGHIVGQGSTNRRCLNGHSLGLHQVHTYNKSRCVAFILWIKLAVEETKN